MEAPPREERATEELLAVRAAVCATARAMHREGLVRLSEGNVSARCGDGSIAITPSGLAYADMRAEDVVVVDGGDGRLVAGTRRPSSELPLHLGLLAALPQYGAVVHTHSPYAVAFACCGRPIPAVTAELLVIGGTVPVARFAEPGTAAVAAAALAALRGGARRGGRAGADADPRDAGAASRTMGGETGGAQPRTADVARGRAADGSLAALRGGRAVLLQNHGVVALGADLTEALTAAVYVEQAAQAAVLSMAVGTPIILGAGGSESGSHGRA